MSQDRHKPRKPIEAEFFIGEPPPPEPVERELRPAEQAPQAVEPTPAKATDDPAELLKQFTAGIEGGGEIAKQAEIARQNAHIESLRMIDLERRRHRREKRTGKRGKR